VADNPVRRRQLYLGYYGNSLTFGAPRVAQPYLYQRCGLFLYVMGVSLDWDQDCENMVRNFDGSPYVRPEEKFVDLREPDTGAFFDHRSMPLEFLQDWARVVDYGWNWNMNFKEIRCPDNMPCAGQPRMGLRSLEN
jgi:hypothetical protein